MTTALSVAAQPASEFDAGPLSWVQAEIDHALGRGLDALASFVAHPRDHTYLRHARMHVHQAAGAMQIIGLDGVVAFIDEIERQLAYLEDVSIGEVPERAEHVDRACRKLQIFLRDVVNGTAPVPLKLFPEYEAMQRMRGERSSSPTDLFHPDLDGRMARQGSHLPAAPKPHSHLVRQRRQYQSGMLAWLRGEEAGARSMRDAIAAIEEASPPGPLRTFWWTARALHDALLEGGLDATFGVKQLAARIDLQIRRLVEGGGKVADRLRREVLYYVAISAPVAPSVVDVQDTFDLAGLIPSPEVLHEDLVRIQPHVREGREQLAHAKDTWLKLTSGRGENLPHMRDTLAAVHAHATAVGHPALLRLVDGLRGRLEQIGSAIPETVAMEFATALLLAENAFGNPAALPPRFAADVDTVLARLDAAREHRVLEDVAPAPVVDEMSRRAQERLLLAQVGREIQANLRHIEQVLDAFFRDHGRRAELLSLKRDSEQIRGALRMLGLDQAAELLTLCQAQIDSYADAGHPVTDDDLELLAESLSGLGFYVEAVEQQRADHERLIAPLLARRRGETQRPEPVPDTSVEADVAIAQAALPDLVAACDVGAPDPDARATLKARLAELGDDARLIGNDELAGQARAALRDLNAGAAPAEALAPLISPAFDPELPLADETQRILAAEASALDDEILGVFITEAREVLDTIGEQYRLLTLNPGDREALRISRRQFHTLKGSGRMVGLADFGEAAWQVEQVHNRLLEEDRPVTPAVLALVGAGEGEFRRWIGQLERYRRVEVDPVRVREAASAVEREWAPARPAAPVSSVIFPGADEIAALAREPVAARDAPGEAIEAKVALDGYGAPDPDVTAANEDLAEHAGAAHAFAQFTPAPGNTGPAPDNTGADARPAVEVTATAEIAARAQMIAGVEATGTADTVPAPETVAPPQKVAGPEVASAEPSSNEEAPTAAGASAERVDTFDLLALHVDVVPEAAAELEAALARDLDALTDLAYPDISGAIAAAPQFAVPEVPLDLVLDLPELDLTPAAPEPPGTEVSEEDAIDDAALDAAATHAPISSRHLDADAAPFDEDERELPQSWGDPRASVEPIEAAPSIDVTFGVAAAEVGSHPNGPAVPEVSGIPEQAAELPAVGTPVAQPPTVIELFALLAERSIAAHLHAGTLTAPPTDDAGKVPPTTPAIPGTGASPDDTRSTPHVAHDAQAATPGTGAARGTAGEASAQSPTDGTAVTDAAVVSARPQHEAIVFELRAGPTTREQAAQADEPGGDAPAAHAPTVAPGEAAADDVAIGDVSVSRSLYEILVAEADGHLDVLAHELALMQVDPMHPPGDAMVRASHTLCGIHRTAGFPLVAEIAKALEYCLAALQDTQMPLSAAAQPVIARAVTGVAGLAGMIKARHGFDPADIEEAEAIQRELEALRVDSVLRARPAMPEAPSAANEPRAARPDAEPAEAPAHGAEQRLHEVRDDVDEQLLPIFLEEADELFPHAGEQLRAWRRHPADLSHALALRRTLHTFKGSARMAGAMRLGELTHRMESRLLDGDSVKAGTAELFEALDADLDRVAFVLDALREGRTDVAVPWDDAARDAQPDATAPAHAPSVVVPLPGAIAPARDEPSSTEHEAAQRAVLRVRADTIDRLVNEAGEVAIARARIEGELRTLKASLLELTSNVIRMRGQVREIEIQAESQIQSRLSMRHDVNPDFDPLEFDRFTRFQELTRSLAEGVNDVSTVQQSLLRNLDEADAALIAQARLSREMQQQLLSIRTVPFGSMGERLYRILRQVAKELDKRVNLDIQGAQVELDRSVLEKLAGPLEHLLRNALDHGIESRAAREQAGKSPTGQIVVAARQVGNEIVLELTDDGGGLDLERIRERAVVRGLITADARPTDAQLIDCIFEPGFSTATRVTAVSGRGIGMDIVRADIAALGGRIEVASRPGAGTTFTLYLPLTLAVAQAVLVRAGNRLWALPAPMVEQVQQIKAEELLDLYARQKIDWEGRPYPLHYLPRLLGDTQQVPLTARFNPVLLLRTGQSTAAVHVDEMIGNQEVVVKNIGPQLARVSGIAGATVLGTGEVVLIINPVQLAQRGNIAPFDPHAEARVAQAQAAGPEPSGPPLVLVVDDSLTVRKITTRMLTREGFAVATAKDGVDALQAMTERVPDVILLDIEMPRMDGFELTRTLKADPRLAHVPIVMITSRTAEKHRNHARELGVDLYLGKPYQEEELLRHLREMLAVTA